MVAQLYNYIQKTALSHTFIMGEPGVVMHTYSPSTWKAEAGEL
jgi:hypothetical protein